LVDARPSASAKTHGRFPTAVHIPPKSLLDPDLIQKELEVVESLRGSVHIVVMGEGVDAIPRLYDHALTPDELALSQEDSSRTEICALFFIKLGFPFVSILDGGFAAAHSFLYRERLFPMSKVLVDYEDNESIWAKLEKAHENPFGEVSRQISDLVDTGISMGRRGLTATKLSLERMAIEHGVDGETRQKVQSGAKNLMYDVQSRIERFNKQLADANGLPPLPKTKNPFKGMGHSVQGVELASKPASLSKPKQKIGFKLPSFNKGGEGPPISNGSQDIRNGNPWSHLKLGFNPENIDEKANRSTLSPTAKTDTSEVSTSQTSNVGLPSVTVPRFTNPFAKDRKEKRTSEPPTGALDSKTEHKFQLSLGGLSSRFGSSGAKSKSPDSSNIAEAVSDARSGSEVISFDDDFPIETEMLMDGDDTDTSFLKGGLHQLNQESKMNQAEEETIVLFDIGDLSDED